MNRRLLYLTLLAAAMSANQARAQKVSAPELPTLPSQPVELKLDGQDTVYVFNQLAGQWLCAGNAYGTQTSLSAKGMGVIFQKPEGIEDQFLMVNNSNGSYGRKVFLNSTGEEGGTSYVDYNNQGADKCNWEIRKIDGSKAFELQADTVVNIDGTSNTRAGFNPYDSERETKAQGVFRPALQLSAEKASEYGLTWLAFNKEGYDAIVGDSAVQSQLDLYNYRVSKLMPVINEAVEAGVNVDKSIDAYNNSSATLDELKEACQYAKDMVRNSKMAGATLKDPFVLTDYMTSANCNSLTGWTYECTYDNNGNAGSGGHGTNWQSHSTNYTATDGHAISQFIERWVTGSPGEGDVTFEDGYGHLSDGTLSQVLTNLPAGGYKISCYANACNQNKQGVDSDYRVSGVYLFAAAGDDVKQKAVATEVGVPQKFEFLVTIKEGENLTLGFKTENATANWIFVDDFSLEYCGSDALAMKIAAAQDAAAEAEDKLSAISCYESYTNKLAELIEEAKGLDESSATDEGCEKLISDINESLSLASTNQSLYTQLSNMGDEVYEVASDSKYSKADDLMSFLEEGDDNYKSFGEVNDSYPYDNATLSAYIDYLNKFVADVRKSGIEEGTDITADVLSNADFSNGSTGWSGKNVAVSKDYQNCETYQNTFEQYQELSDLPNGVYEISVNAMHRIANNDVASVLYPADADEITACVYGNDFTEKFKSPYSSKMESQHVTSGNADYAFDGGYIPNSMQGFMEACAENADNYLTKVYALVTDGTLRVGVKEDARPAGRSGDWAIWDNFKIVYMGQNAEAMAACADGLVSKATTLLGSYMNADAKDDLTKAIEAVEAEKNNDNIIALNAAIAIAQTSVSAYKPLNEAVISTLESYEANESSSKNSEEAQAIYNAAMDAANAILNGGTKADDEIAAAIKDLKAGYTKYFIHDIVAQASFGMPVDISKVITNNDFATMDKTGWTINKGNAGFQAGNNVKAVEFYNNNFDICQELVGMPAGNYTLKTRAYYRKSTSDFSDVNAYLYFYNGNDSVQTNIKSVDAGKIAVDDENLADVFPATDGLTKSTIDGVEYYMPNNMVTAQTALNSEMLGSNYDSEIEFSYDGSSSFVVGMNKTTLVTNDWTFIKSFSLSYEPFDPAGINSAKSDVFGDAVSAEIYDLNGMKLAGLKKGVNIVKTTMSDGSVKVRKVVVK